MNPGNTHENHLISLIHDYNIDPNNREIYLHSSLMSEEEGGVDYKSAIVFEKNIRYFNLISSDPILVHMHLPGGDWEDCMAIYDTIKSSKSKIIILAYGKVQSASSILFQAADLRILMPNVNMLIHYGSISIEDEHKAAITSLQWSAKESVKMIDIFVDKWLTSPMSQEKNWKKVIARKHIHSQLANKTDWILTAEEAVYYGFADGIFGSKQYPNIESVKTGRKKNNK
jgi:ATP-dependent protease ClpP protease subunit